MNESEWMGASDPLAMLLFLKEANSYLRFDPQLDRKMRLFACACCRELEDVLPAAAGLGIALGEALADRRAHPVKVRHAQSEVERALPRNIEKNVVPGQGLLAVSLLLDADWDESMDQAHWNVIVIVRRLNVAIAAAKTGSALNRMALAALEVFGNPFRNKPKSQKWKNAEVMALASEIYETRSFSRLPELADLLQSAGCDDNDLLAHCRSTGPHVAGCWAIDDILERDLDTSLYKKRARKSKSKPVEPPLEEGAVWVTVEEPYGVVFVYDEGNRAALEQSPLAEFGIDLYDDKKASGQLRTSGLLQMLSFDTREREDPFVAQVYVGPPPPKEKLTAKSASKGHCGDFQAPTGRVRLEGATSMTIGPTEPDNPSVEANIPPGVYEMGCYVRKADKVHLLVFTPAAATKAGDGHGAG